MGKDLNNAYLNGLNDANRALERGRVNEGLGQKGNDKGVLRRRFEERLEKCLQGDEYSCGVTDALEGAWNALKAFERLVHCGSNELRLRNKEICQEPPLRYRFCQPPIYVLKIEDLSKKWNFKIETRALRSAYIGF